MYLESNSGSISIGNQQWDEVYNWQQNKVLQLYFFFSGIWFSIQAILFVSQHTIMTKCTFTKTSLPM
jgi:hypothetical protein